MTEPTDMKPTIRMLEKLLATVESLQECTLTMEARVANMAEQALLRDLVAARLQDGLFYIAQRAREASEDEKPIDSAWLLMTAEGILYADGQPV